MSRQIQVRQPHTNKAGFAIYAINKYMVGSRYRYGATGLNTGCTKDEQVSDQHNIQKTGPAIYTNNPDSQHTQHTTTTDPNTHRQYQRHHSSKHILSTKKHDVTTLQHRGHRYCIRHVTNIPDPILTCDNEEYIFRVWVHVVNRRVFSRSNKYTF